LKGNTLTARKQEVYEYLIWGKLGDGKDEADFPAKLQNKIVYKFTTTFKSYLLYLQQALTYSIPTNNSYVHAITITIPCYLLSKIYIFRST
jgi:hypothetical protein